MAAALEKVKRHPKFADRTDIDQKALAEEFTDPVQIKRKFEDILDTKEMEENIAEIGRCAPMHSLEVANQKDQQKYEVARACYLPVQLFLSKLNRELPKFLKQFTPLIRLAFGPLHAGLIVGGVVIEWDDGSLVVPSLDVPVQDVCTYVSDDGEWHDYIGEAVGRMSLAHRQNLDIPQKLEIVYQSRKEKETLIDRLVEVIVDYNRRKQYSLFKCNCQDFVKDALQALGIKKIPVFEGNLKAYVESLQGGKPQKIVFSQHADLDSYVERNREALDTHEKEYCVLVYFEFHAKITAELAPEELERWQCLEPRCLCSDLEEEIVNDSLHFYKYQKQQKTKAEAKQRPPLRTIREETIADGPLLLDEDDRMQLDGSLADSARQYLHPQESVEDQATYLSKCSGYSGRIKAKLHNHSNFVEATDADIIAMSEVLGEREPFRDRYFKKFDVTCIKTVNEVSHDQSCAGSVSRSELRKRSNKRFERILNVDMRLLLRASSRRTWWRLLGGLGSTPLHCALQVGDFVFEWNESSLVIPVDVGCSADAPVLFSPVQEQSEWFAKVQSEREAIQESVVKNNYEMQIALYFKWTEEKEKILLNFIDKVVEFNRRREYHPHSCNSQFFVGEAMKALGISKPPKLSSTIKEHINDLAKSITQHSLKGISSHANLDTTVAAHLDKLSQVEIEYLMAHYLMFHMDSYERNKQPKWKCPVLQCRLTDLEEKLAKVSHYSSDSQVIL